MRSLNCVVWTKKIVGWASLRIGRNLPSRSDWIHYLGRNGLGKDHCWCHNRWRTVRDCTKHRRTRYHSSSDWLIDWSTCKEWDNDVLDSDPSLRIQSVLSADNPERNRSQSRWTKVSDEHKVNCLNEKKRRVDSYILCVIQFQWRLGWTLVFHRFSRVRFMVLMKEIELTKDIFVRWWYIQCFDNNHTKLVFDPDLLKVVINWKITVCHASRFFYRKQTNNRWLSTGLWSKIFTVCNCWW